jgi:5'-nucleotidase
VCACPEAVVEGATCTTNPAKKCASGSCVLGQCRDDIASYQRNLCAKAPTADVQKSCDAALSPCVTGGEECKFLACVDRRLGNFSDGRLLMVGQ